MDMESAAGTFNTHHILAMSCHGNLRAKNSDLVPPIMITVRFNGVPLTSLQEEEAAGKGPVLYPPPLLLLIQLHQPPLSHNHNAAAFNLI